MRFLLPFGLAAATCLALLQGASGCKNPPKAAPQKVDATKPTLRLYLMSTLAGALEPCGCSKDQLGGLDHLASYVEAERAKPGAPPALFLAAGPLWFLDPKLEADHAAQDEWKAESIAGAMKAVGLDGWAPGYNDWAAGDTKLASYAKTASSDMLGANLDVRGVTRTKIYELGGVKVGVVGISDPRDAVGGLPNGVQASPADAAASAVKGGIEALRKDGARLFVVLAAMNRGAALRVLDQVPGIHVLAVGKGRSPGAANTSQPAPEMVGKTLVVETANHGQTLAIVDLHLAPTGTVSLADGGVARAVKINELSRRIRDLEVRINSWEAGGKVDPKDLAARKADLTKAKAEREALQEKVDAPTGAFFRYRVQEVREGLGESPPVRSAMVDYYKRVNDHNKKAFADRKPLPAAEGESGYIGVDACSDCHFEEREVWDKGPHVKAYATLEKDHKEFNLDCVSCHVTGYGKPGGSTVTHVAKLKNVQCETCHGPGSRHAKKPEDKSLIILKPDPKGCVDQCHHPPHVEGFDPVAKMALVLGPGHGMDDDD